MKKLILFLTIMAIMPTGHAIPSEGTTGLMPSSPLWHIDRFFESAHLAITQSPEDKATLKMQHAEERLGEAYYMGLIGHENAVEKTLQVYEGEIASAQENALTIADSKARLKVQHEVKNEITSQKQSITQLGNLINRISMPNESKQGLNNALESVSKTSDASVANLDNQIQQTKHDVEGQYGQSDVEDIENLAQGKVSDSLIKSLVADWNSMTFDDSLSGKLDGCYHVEITDNGKTIQSIHGFITLDEIKIVDSLTSVYGKGCFTQQIHSEDVMAIVGAIESQDTTELFKIGKRYGYGVTDLIGMARERGIEVSVGDLN